MPVRHFFKFDSKSSRELRGQVCEKKSPLSTVSTLRFRPPTLQKGLSQKDAERKEGRCRKILQLQKFRKEGERKKFRGSLSAENAEWEQGENARSAPPANFLGEERKGDGGRGGWRGGRRRDRDCDFLKFAVCCDNNDLGEEREGRTAKKFPADAPSATTGKTRRSKHNPQMREGRQKTSGSMGKEYEENHPRRQREQILSCLSVTLEISQAISHHQREE